MIKIRDEHLPMLPHPMVQQSAQVICFGKPNKHAMQIKDNNLNQEN